MAHTNRHLARNLGIALLLAATLLAALFLATQSPSGPASVAAHPCATEDDAHVDFRGNGVSCIESTHDDPHEHSIEVDGGRYRDLVFKAYIPAAYRDDGDSIIVGFERSFGLPASGTTLENNEITIGKGELSTPAPVSIVGQVEQGNRVTLDLTDSHSTIFSGFSDDDYITITFKASARIETPETPWGPDTPRAADDSKDEEEREEKGYEVFLAFVDGNANPVSDRPASDRNFIVVKNPISSTVPSATVRVELHTFAETEIQSTDEIVVNFSGPSADSGFILPTSMATSRIQVDYKKDGSSKKFNPSEVQIQGDRVIFAVPFEKDDTSISVKDDYTITFSNLARIKNPFSAGIKKITVSSFVSGDLEDEIEAIVRRTTTLNPPEGARGSEFTLEGKGYAAGTVTVYQDEENKGQKGRIDPGETLSSVKTVRGAFRVKLTARGNPGTTPYIVRARDSEGEEVSIGFDIKSSISFEPGTVSLGSRLKIIISDWEEERDEVVAVQIAGVPEILSDAIGYANCIEHPNAKRRDEQGRITLYVDVPSDIPAGEQTVAVFDHSQLDYSDENGNPVPEDKAKACHKLDDQTFPGERIGPLAQTFRTDDPIAITKSTVEIEGRSLTLSPATAVRGQRVTVSGFGFGRGGNLTSVSINGEPVDERPEQFEVSTTGFISITVTVPTNIPVGTNEVRVTGANNTLGTGTLTVPEPEATVSPSESRAGTEVTVTGSGFIANTPVRVTYADTHVAAGFADASGNVSLPFRVPLSAEIGRSYPVTVQAEVSGTEVSASATHSPALSTIATEPAEVSVGDLLTISGRDLPPFAIVRPIEIDGRNVTPFPAPTTDATGAFEVEVRVPGTPVGDQPLRVVAGGVVLTHTITVVPLPLSGPPARVFRDLINEGSLIAVWRYVNETQVWNLFDPNVPEELSELNDLTYVGTGDIVWLETTAQVEFQGDILNAGWSLIRLK